MSKKRQEAAENDLIKSIDAMQELQKLCLDRISDKLLDIDETKDPAEKIMKLRDMRRYIDTTVDDVRRNLLSLAKDHALRYRPKLRDMFSSQMSVEDRIFQRKNDAAYVIEKRADTKAFLQDMVTLKVNVREMLDETVRHCDLQEISDSPYFSDAYKAHEPLRDRFTAAAAARAALGDNTEAPQADKKEPANDTGKTPANDADKAPAAQQRKTRSYEKVRQVKKPGK